MHEHKSQKAILTIKSTILSCEFLSGRPNVGSTSKEKWLPKKVVFCNAQLKEVKVLVKHHENFVHEALFDRVV